MNTAVVDQPLILSDPLKLILEGCPDKNTNLKFGLFQSQHGYRSGYILQTKSERYDVLIFRDEKGNEVHSFESFSRDDEVKPHRKFTSQIYIQTSKCAKGYIRAGYPIQHKLGSGLYQNKGKREYPIYNPLTLHSCFHLDLLNRISEQTVSIINEYLNTNAIPEDILERILWLLNVSLYIDKHPAISREVFLQSILDFCLDYTSRNLGNFIEQPLNYILRPIGIDGIYSTFSKISISFIPTDFEGITYSDK